VLLLEPVVVLLLAAPVCALLALPLFALLVLFALVPVPFPQADKSTNANASVASDPMKRRYAQLRQFPFSIEFPSSFYVYLMNGFLRQRYLLSASSNEHLPPEVSNSPKFVQTSFTYIYFN
jgi:hypothetical protein